MSGSSTYTVVANDTLGKIAKQHGVGVTEIAQLNGIKNPDRISVGQKLKLPVPPPQQPDEKPAEDEPAQGAFIWVRFVDALSRPIQNLRVLIKTAEDLMDAETDADGNIPAIEADADVPLAVHVQKADGGLKQVAALKVPAGNQHLTLVSPKVKVTATLRKHEGAPGVVTPPRPQVPGEERSTRSPNGSPVHEVALECPNPQNLKLGPNFKYRDIVIAAAARASMQPQAVAAIMRAEAATIVERYEKPIVDPKTKKQRVDKKGKPMVRVFVKDTQEWNPRSASPLSSARGMTQFLDGTWLDLAFTDGTFLHAKLKKLDWLISASVEIKKKGKDSEWKLVPAFKLADGTLVTKQPLARTLGSRPYLTGRATAADANLQAVLDLRLDPECAIHTAVDYGMQNLAMLRRAGYAADALNDADKAKIVYLCHHLGTEAQSFIGNSISETRAQLLLETQLGVAGAKKKAAVHKESYLAAHRGWLNAFVNSKIVLANFYCQPVEEVVRELVVITESLRQRI